MSEATSEEAPEEAVQPASLEPPAEVPSPLLVDVSSPPEFEGTWERAGRSPITAALVALLGIGVLYFNAQSIAVAIIMIATKGLEHLADGGTRNAVAEMTKRAQIPLLFTLMVTQYVLMLGPTV